MGNGEIMLKCIRDTDKTRRTGSRIGDSIAKFREREEGIVSRGIIRRKSNRSQFSLGIVGCKKGVSYGAAACTREVNSKSLRHLKWITDVEIILSQNNLTRAAQCTDTLPDIRGCAIMKVRRELVPRVLFGLSYHRTEQCPGTFIQDPKSNITEVALIPAESFVLVATGQRTLCSSPKGNATMGQRGRYQYRSLSCSSKSSCGESTGLYIEYKIIRQNKTLVEECPGSISQSPLGRSRRTVFG